MRPAPFDYRDPDSVTEACEVLTAHRGRAAVLAGGQSLIPQLSARQRRPGVVLSIGRIAELDTVQVESGMLRVGATVTQRTLQRAAAAVPVLGEALGHVGHVPTRNRGTFGGSIAFADPAAELPLVLLGLGGSVRARSVHGERVIPAGELFVGPFATSLRPDELLTAVELPVPGPGWRWAFEQRHFRRHAKVSAVAGAGPDGAVRAALTGVADRPVPLPVPQGVTGADVAAVAAGAAALVAPIEDRYGSVDYRARLVVLAAAAALNRVLDRRPTDRSEVAA